MKKVLSLLLIIMLLCTVVITGCSNDGGDTADPTGGDNTSKDYLDDIAIAEVNQADKYRNYYQIWIGSFCDSNNDETGDIQGIISQLDYLNDGDPETDTDLGVNGIWLSPMMPSVSYHKYDVTDYYNIDEEFGTLEDFDQLIAECNKRGIRVVIDLVLNHISSRHPWFAKACEEVKAGNFDGYAKYFEFVKSNTMPGEGYRQVSGSDDLWYEGNFTYEMPDWNLSSEATREEFKKISKFWLDRGVSGFRLDAVKYFTNDHTDSVEFLEWYCSMCREIDPDVYIVGENWVGTGEIYETYKSGIDSQFAFKFGNTDGTFIMTAKSGNLGKKTINQMKRNIENIKENNPDAINAWFLTNHDMTRSANALKKLADRKMAAALYLLSPGCTFTYYGEELGIAAPNTTNDASYRTPMVWDSENLPDIYVPGVDGVEAPEQGGVKQQLENEDSLLNFYKRVFKIKNQNPEIARGTITDTVEFDDNAVGAYYVEYEGSKLLIIHNTATDSEKTLTITESIMKNSAIRGDLIAGDPATDAEGNTVKQEITLQDGQLVMPAQSTVILKAE